MKGYEIVMNVKNIKFKAKRLDNSEWVEGYFYQECDNTYIIEDRQGESMLNRNHLYEVDPSTVCQFTGLKDSNGVEIWEGDYISSIYSYPKQKKVEFKNGTFGIETYYRGLDFLPFACCDIRAGCLIEFELEDRKEGEK